MKRVIVAAMVILALAASAVVLVGCGEKSVPSGSIAVVGDVSITQEQFDATVAQAKASYAAQGVDFPAVDTPQYNELKAQIVDYLVQKELISQKAAEMGVEVTSTEVDERIAGYVTQSGGQKKFDALLKKSGISAEDLRAQLEVQMLQEKVRKEVGKDVVVTAEEIQAFYDDPDNKSQFEVPDTIDARHVLVKTKAEALAVQRALEADSSDANWKKVAKKYSIDPGSKGTRRQPRQLPRRPHGQGVRGRSLQPQSGDRLRSGQDAVRVSRHRGDQEDTRVHDDVRRGQGRDRGSAEDRGRDRRVGQVGRGSHHRSRDHLPAGLQPHRALGDAHSGQLSIALRVGHEVEQGA